MSPAPPNRQPNRQPLDLTKEASLRAEEERPAQRAVRWSLILLWFMRVVALLWIAKGLMSWGVILDVVPLTPAFEARTLGFRSTVVYFAVIDLVAAVGLWLASSWGGVLWLLAVMSHLILTLFFPRVVSGDPVTVSLFGVLVLTYLTVSWLAASDE